MMGHFNTKTIGRIDHAGSEQGSGSLHPDSGAAAKARDSRLIRILRSGLRRSGYRLALARSSEEIRSAQALRYQVFNVEMGCGLPESSGSGLDADDFDPVFDHLIVTGESGEIVGTYRIQSGKRSLSQMGFYSAREFDLSPFDPIRDRVIEIGRACVKSGHRNASVLGLLWLGVHDFARKHDALYILGCSSLPATDPHLGAKAFENLRQTHLAPEPIRASPLPCCRCPLDQVSDDPVPLPKLFTTYLDFGAKICGPPAIDRAFRTIDFLSVLDFPEASEAAAREGIR
jgi:putative hemolysin